MVGVLGSGKFGIALAKLLAHNTEVLVYSRRLDIVSQINDQHKWQGIDLQPNIYSTTDLKMLCDKCMVIIPVIPSAHFRSALRSASPFLKAQHILVHGTKGFDNQNVDTKLAPSQTQVIIKTMSQVVLEETNVLRIGAISGPNLADEILAGLPTAAVIASQFEEVIQLGKRLLSSENFYVFGSHDIRGAELAGALKNVIALATGIIAGKELGKNIEAMLIVRGLHEMIQIGGVLGSSTEAFFGAAGIGDLIATATSIKSRNFACGVRLARGETIEHIVESSAEAIEGVRTLELVMRFIREQKLRAPIMTTVHDIVFDGADIDYCIKRLMKFPLTPDVDFIS